MATVTGKSLGAGDGPYLTAVTSIADTTYFAVYVDGQSEAERVQRQHLGLATSAALTAGLAGKAALSHSHALADISDAGTAAAAAAADFATAAQGAKADTAVQPGDLGTAAAADAGDFATAAQGSAADSAVQPGDLATVATSGDYDDLSGKPTLGTAAAASTGDFATAAQGGLADSAVQPGDLSTVATSNSYNDLDDTPTLGSAAAADTGDFATAAQGTTADSALQPGDVKNSVEVDSGSLQLVGDEAAPGNNKIYGTDGSGARGWKDDPSGGADTDAIHVDESGEIAGLTAKASPVSADLLVIEDSEDTNAKKKVQIGDLPGGGGGSSTFTGLTDTPASYSGMAGRVAVVNSGETALEFVDTTTVRVEELIEEITLETAGEFDFDSIPGTYEDLIIYLRTSVEGTPGSQSVQIFFNDDLTSSNYHEQRIVGSNGVPGAFESTDSRLLSVTDASVAAFSAEQVARIPNYAATTMRKFAISTGVVVLGSDNLRTGVAGVIWEVDDGSNAITRVRLRSKTHGSNELLGVAKLYGVREAQVPVLS